VGRDDLLQVVVSFVVCLGDVRFDYKQRFTFDVCVPDSQHYSQDDVVCAAVGHEAYGRWTE
jgi:hypothetical protein